MCGVPNDTVYFVHENDVQVGISVNLQDRKI